MDRQIPQKVKNRQRRNRLIKLSAIATGIIAVTIGLTTMMRSSIKRSDITFATVDTGTIESTVSASGKVVPAFEEIINSPINTRIREVYCKAGDRVNSETPLLGLDLTTTRTEYEKLLDAQQMNRLQLEQLRLNNATTLKDLEMRVQVKEMAVNRLRVELRNEQYLDSLGSGTGDNVRQSELAYETGRLELAQLRQQLDNERKVKDADIRVKELELQIAAKNLAEMERTLADARIRSPREGVLTYINNQIGAQVSQGSQVAIVSDLSHFKVECEIADSYGDRVAVGSGAIVKIGKRPLRGSITNVTPLSQNGVMSFTVQLDDDSAQGLRSGLKTDVYVMSSVIDGALRLRNGSYYTGKGDYELWVLTGDNELTKRKVTLGMSNYEMVEVISGLRPGDQVVISDMTEYRTKKSLKIK